MDFTNVTDFPNFPSWTNSRPGANQNFFKPLSPFLVHFFPFQRSSTTTLLTPQILFWKSTFCFMDSTKVLVSMLKIRPDQDYLAAERIVLNLKVVNDTAERGVKLIQDYNSILTNDEDQKQYLLQVVQQQRRNFPDASKNRIIAGMKSIVD